jgi:hypothetical protein
MRHALAAIKAPVFLGGPIALIPPFLKIGLGGLRQEHAPCGLEIGARHVERRRRAVLAFARLGSRIEAAAPLPLRGGVRVADRAHDRADVQVAVMSAPSLLMGVRNRGAPRRRAGSR